MFYSSSRAKQERLIKKSNSIDDFLNVLNIYVEKTRRIIV
jgi:hypothetical protein